MSEARSKRARRTLLWGVAAASAAALCGVDKLLCLPALEAPSQKATADAKMIEAVPFSGEAGVPMGEAFGAELDGRLYTDLMLVNAEKPVTPVDEFYVRTRASTLLKDGAGWTVKISGQVAKAFELGAEQLRGMAKPMGRHLMECAGNARSVHFGMISVADWNGVTIAEIIERAKPSAKLERILVSGFDTYATKSATSVPGASWSFAISDLEKAGAFLATEMNGAALTKDHGAPVRLVVPGWYGCTCIKWVNEIAFTENSVEATSQMQEYAARTMQSGVPELARDFRPAIIESAAMPVRIEKWVVHGKIEYRIVGILWGGSMAVKRLQIRFNPDEDYVDVDELFEGNGDAWRFWKHVWKPQKTGSYLIRLRVSKPPVVARRLDSGYYLRSVDILEV